jgi:hypothetical protein
MNYFKLVMFTGSMVFFWYTKHIDLVALTGYVTLMQEVFHVLDTSYYYVVGALSGAVALHCNMRSVGEVFPAVRYNFLSISPELLLDPENWPLETVTVWFDNRLYGCHENGC